MDLPDELQNRLDAVLALRDTYTYRHDSLQSKTFIAMIAPTATGKSTVIDRILARAKSRGMDADEVGTLTTRPARPSDPSNYQTDIPHETMISLIEQGRVVNWSLFPTGHIYATTADSFGAEYNFLPLIPDSLPMLRRAGFKQVHSLYVTIPPEQWERQLNARAETSDNVMFRLVEARESLKYSREHEDDLLFIANEPGEEALEKLADRTLDMITGSMPAASDPTAIHYRNQMTQYVKDFLNGNA